MRTRPSARSSSSWECSTAALAPAPAGARGPSVTAALSSLKSSGAITEAAYRQYAGAYAAANSSLRRLSGTRRAELAAVIANTQQMAAAGQFAATRLPVIFLTLEKNRQWWTTQPLVSSRVRVSFPPSRLVWEYYAGQGIQIQWLGTFGEATATTCPATKTPTCASCCRSAAAGDQTRRGHRVGVHVPLRRRRAAVDERAVAGHRPAGDGALVVALQRTCLPDRRPAGARDLSRRLRPRGCA